MTKNSVKLHLDKPYYVAGEVVQGRVDVSIVKPVVVDEVKIKWVGTEKTKVENTVKYQEGEEWHERTDKYKEKKEFFKEELVLAKVNGGTLAEGTHAFTFQYQLPGELPGVFFDERRESDGDKVRAAIMYKVKIKVDKPGSDIEAKQLITIAPMVTKSNVPIQVKNDKKFMMGGSGRLYMVVDIAKTVFCPGETLAVKVAINNESKKNVKATKIKLMREVKVSAKHMHKSDTRVVHKESYEGCDKKESKDLMLQFTLPADAYPSTKGKYCSCRYWLDVEMDVPMAPDLEVHPDIVIALVPAAGMAAVPNIFANYAPGGW